MATGARFIPRPGWAQELLRQPEAAGAILRLGGDLSESIKSEIPVVTGQTKREYGAMAPRPAHDEAGLASAEIPIESSIWHIIEFGARGGKNPAFAPIRRGADALGMEIDMGGPA